VREGTLDAPNTIPKHKSARRGLRKRPDRRGLGAGRTSKDNPPPRSLTKEISVPHFGTLWDFCNAPQIFSPSHIAERISCSAKLRIRGRGRTDKFLLNHPEHWRARAEEARILAKEMKDSETKDALLRIGDSYEHLAEWVEDWALRRLSKN
jgi:hypothetical protein